MSLYCQHLLGKCVQVIELLPVKLLLERLHVVLHCATSFWQPQHIPHLVPESY